MGHAPAARVSAARCSSPSGPSNSIRTRGRYLSLRSALSSRSMCDATRSRGMPWRLAYQTAVCALHAASAASSSRAGWARNRDEWQAGRQPRGDFARPRAGTVHPSFRPHPCSRCDAVVASLRSWATSDSGFKCRYAGVGHGVTRQEFFRGSRPPTGSVGRRAYLTRPATCAAAPGRGRRRGGTAPRRCAGRPKSGCRIRRCRCGCRRSNSSRARGWRATAAPGTGRRR